MPRNRCSHKPPSIPVLLLVGFLRNVQAAEDSACNDVVAAASSANAYELWEGASHCGRSDDMARAMFLLLAGQIRAMTDIAVLEPSSDEEQINAADLYGTLYYRHGGSGDVEILRDAHRTESLLNDLKDWNPIWSDSYNPGWDYEPTIDPAGYSAMLTCQRALRIAKLSWYASLVRDNEYYEASKELDALRSANPGPVEVGSDLNKQMAAITERMNAASADKPMPMDAPEECAFAMNYQPDADSDVTQLHSGANGPGSRGAYAFESHDGVLQSWIAKALPAADLGRVLSEIDFDSQIIVAVSFGESRNATGNIYISDVDYNSVHDSLGITGMIGVNEANCNEPYASAYPFVLAAVPRPETVPKIPNMFLQNFPDGCKPPISGSPVTAPR